MRTCTICGTKVENHEPCPQCSDESKWPDVSKMTGEERLAEFNRWGDTLEISFTQFHKRINQIFGRGVFTHEMVISNMTNLRTELLLGIHPSMDDIIEMIPVEKRIIIDEDDLDNIS